MIHREHEPQLHTLDPDTATTLTQVLVGAAGVHGFVLHGVAGVGYCCAVRVPAQPAAAPRLLRGQGFRYLSFVMLNLGRTRERVSVLPTLEGTREIFFAVLERGGTEAET